jgi:hypothetical protein
MASAAVSPGRVVLPKAEVDGCISDVGMPERFHCSMAAYEGPYCSPPALCISAATLAGSLMRGKLPAARAMLDNNAPGLHVGTLKINQPFGLEPFVRREYSVSTVNILEETCIRVKHVMPQRNVFRNVFVPQRVCYGLRPSQLAKSH